MAAPAYLTGTPELVDWASTFLLLTGYEEVRSVVAALAGDWKAAREVHLELPETGACSLAPLDPLIGEKILQKGYGAYWLQIR